MARRNSSVPNSQSTTPRRSPRLLHQNHKSSSEPQHPNTPRKPQNPKPSRLRQGFRHSTEKSSYTKSIESISKSRNSIGDSFGSRRSPRLNKGVDVSPCLRRSPRISNQHNDSQRKGTKKSSKLNNGLGDSENLTPRPRKSTSVPSKRVKSLKCLRSNSKISVDQVGARRAKTKEDSFGTSVVNCERMTRDVFVNNEGMRVEGREEKARNGNVIKVGVKRKRNCIEGGEELEKGWTEQQELALQRAYLAAKPSPHFWKKVSKLVPGKSQQDCFDRIHRDYLTPPQSQPRSRAKAIKSLPLQEFSFSASKLLKPIDKKVRRSNILKPKSCITRKSVEQLLQRHLKADQDRQGDIFSVLEPNFDFFTNNIHPTDALSTPKQLKENQGMLQTCTETSFSSHKKSLPNLNSSCITELVSPPVLKKVKNKVLHEKYIHQLRCREARRTANSARIQMPSTGKLIEGSSIQKRDVVKAAKVSLVSEARDAINKFQLAQANCVDNSCSSDEDNDYGIGVESAESQ